MTTFNELREKTTPDIIKKMCELAEGFRMVTNIFINTPHNTVSNKEIIENKYLFPLLIHRAVEGFNKINKPTGNYGLYIDREKITYCNFKLPRNEEKIYDFKNYLPCHLTQCEMAIWDCLLEVLK